METKPWWQSRAQVGAIMSTISLLLATTGVVIDATVLTETALILGALIFNGITIWGNVTRKTAIDHTKVLPGFTIGGD
jgi:hypothetical protein